ncbi:hypothetical protein TNCT_675011 [Trichonephila clavata]|uniref:Uncharacterized protein n=1 Tax=Trichonephila clavata TaxID=2740835 RepID=A0A8X6LX83_TRICU|nr:hypothetical protein TNCT_675011 [Trichonephila clavata]
METQELSHSSFRLTDIGDTFTIMGKNMAGAADFRSFKTDQEQILRTGNKNITEISILLEHSEKAACIPKSNPHLLHAEI